MTADQLKGLMKEHGWNSAMVAAIAMVSSHTVRAWLRPQTSKAHRNMKPQACALLEEQAGVGKSKTSGTKRATPPASRKTS